MMSKAEVFELEVVTDDPRYEGFALEEAPSLLGREDLEEDLLPGYEVSEELREWSPTNLSELWKPPRVEGRVTSFNDYPGLNLILPAFSRRACDALIDLLKPNGEILPLDSDQGEFFFFNITRLVDALDKENSVCEYWCDPPTTATDISYYAFHQEKIADLPIFRIYERPIVTFVSRQFVDRVNESGLNGFHFNKLWPIPKGTNWREFNKEGGESREGLGNQTLVIRLPLEGMKASKTERTRASEIEDAIDAQLIVPSLASPYFGSLAGTDIAEGEIRLFISCPDAAQTFRKLETWLRGIEWRPGVQVVFRYGRLHDTEAREETFELAGC